MLAGSFATALLVTAPLALLAGYPTGRRFTLHLAALLAGGWLALTLHHAGFAYVLEPYGWRHLLGELLAIALVGALFHRLGASLRKATAVAAPV